MADSIRVLGQLSPSASTLTTLYTVPSLKKATISSFYAANRESTATTIRASVAVTGETDSLKQYIYYDIELPENETFVATVGITMSETDVFRVYSPSSGVSFNLFGVETS